MIATSGDAFLVAAASAFLRLDQPPLQAVQVGQHKLGFHDFDVAQRVDRAFHMGDVAVLETAQHVDDGVHFADVGEELVAQTLAFGCAADEARDIDEFQAGGDDLDRLADLRQHVQTRVGHADAADVRLDRAERVIRRLRRGGRGQRVEQGRFADIGQADDAAVETH